MKTHLISFGLLLLTACGESRSVQCSQMGDILNGTSTQLLSASGTSTGFAQGAALADQAAVDLAALNLEDKKLSSLRSHLVAAYQAIGQTSREMDAIAGADGTVISNTRNREVTARFEQASQAFNTVFKAAQTYCNGGDVPPEFTEQPAP
ncbi:MAG: hypothetical protein AAFZ80_02190 [Cyanobacteria bacterium P01_A01_bin.105]